MEGSEYAARSAEDGVEPASPTAMARRRTRSQLRDEVVSHVRESIVSGRLLPGTRLPLASLAEEIGISATPVREGLLSLVQDGWLVQELNRGFRVAALNRRDVLDAYKVYAFVAGELAALAAEHPTPEAIARMREIDETIRRAHDPNDEHVEATNYELHRAIYELAAAPRLVWFIEAAARFVPRRFWPTIPGWSEFNAQAHAEIIDAIEAGDVERSRTLMADHISTARGLLIAHLDRIRFWTQDTSES